MSSRLSQFTRASYSSRKSAPRPISVRPISVATSIDESATEFEDAPAAWSRSELGTTTEEELEVSDMESLRSKTKKMAELLDNSSASERRGYDSDAARTCESITSYDEIPTPANRSPLPEYTATFVFNPDYKNCALFNDEPSPPYSGVMSTIGPKGPHLFCNIDTTAIPSSLDMSLPTPVTPSSEGPAIRPRSQLSAIASDFTIEEVRTWSTTRVCAWLATLGFENAIIENFENNDITGAILVDLKWDDLKELNIKSFGKRAELWSELHHLRNGSSVCPSEESSTGTRSRKNSTTTSSAPSSPVVEDNSVEVPIVQMKEVKGSPTLLPSSMLGRAFTGESVESSADEAVNEAAVVRAVRKKKQAQRRKAKARKPVAHTYATSEDEAPVRKQKKRSSSEKCRKHSQGAASSTGSILIVTSSSVGAPAEEASVNTRPSSIVVPSIIASSDVLGPIQGRELKLQEQYLRDVGRVDTSETIQRFLRDQAQTIEKPAPSPPPVPQKSAEDIARASAPKLTLIIPTQDSFPTRQSSVMKRDPMSAPVDSFSPVERLKTPAFGQRMRSPTMLRTTTPFSEMDVPTSNTPIDMRNQSQSVPPDMRFRRFTPTPTTPNTMTARKASIARNFPQMAPAPAPIPEAAELESNERQAAPAPGPRPQHSGWMKKRKTNWFRHEWPEYHFELHGTRLGYAKNVSAPEEGFIEVEDYSVACSQSASTKLAAAFKSLKAKSNKKQDEKTFMFSLVPAGDRRRQVSGKVHHFAVDTRADRIDWMRELMLAKAIKQKGQGAELLVNTSN